MGGALVDVAAGRLTMRASDRVNVVDVYKAIKLSMIYEELSEFRVIDEARNHNILNFKNL